MKKTLIFTTIILLTSFLTEISFAEEYLFDRNLSYGNRGEDIIQLQKVLNREMTTVVATLGPGSPGQETDFFGSLTKNAVIRYQNKYKNEILLPVGLSDGTGFVGPSTRSKLNQQAKTINEYTSTNYKNKEQSFVEQTLIKEQSIEEDIVKKNQQNLDYHIATIRRIGLQQGISENTLSDSVEGIKNLLATTTDLMALFEEKVANEIPGISLYKTPTGKYLVSGTAVFPQKETTLFSVVGSPVDSFKKLVLGWPKEARAIAFIPFGGYLVPPAFPCTCTEVFWYTLINGTPLSYLLGSQAYVSYKIGSAWLGLYEPSSGECEIIIFTGCVPVPTVGIITPTVGTSAS